jgi:hypothetical protein
LNKIKTNKLIVKDIGDVRDGILAGRIKDFLFHTQKTNDDCQKIYFGKNINRYCLNETNIWVEYNLKKMMKLEMERVGNTGPGLRMRNSGIFEREKIIYRKVGKEIIATIDEIGIYYEQTVHSCHITDKQFLPKYVLAIFNSNLIKYFYHKTNSQGGDIFPQVRISSVEKLPVKLISLDAQNKIIGIVDDILKLKKNDKQFETSNLEQQIDNLVYRLYNLTYDEVKVIDPEIENKLSEEDYNFIEIE